MRLKESLQFSEHPDCTHTHPETFQVTNTIYTHPVDIHRLAHLM